MIVTIVQRAIRKSLDQDRELAELGEPNAIRPITTGSSGSS